MKITWSIPVRGELLNSFRGDLVRARCLIEAMRADGHDVVVVVGSTQTGSNFIVSTYRGFVRRVLPKRFALVLRDVGRCVHALAHGRRVAAEARKRGVDVIIETQVNFAGSGVLASRITGLPLVLDDCSPVSEEAFLGAGVLSLARRILRQQTESASVIVVVSNILREQFIKGGVQSDKLVVVPNGFDATAYNCVDRAAVRKRLGLDDRFVFGFVGSFQPWHRVELLVEALKRMASDNPVHLLLVGDGDSKESVLAAGRHMGVYSHITAVGPVHNYEVPELISSFDVGVLPGTMGYGHPMKLMEYAAAGVATIAPDLPSVREVLKDGVTGLLFPPGDINALTDAIVRLATDHDLRKRLGECARNRVAVGTSWTDRARAILSHIAPR